MGSNWNQIKAFLYKEYLIHKKNKVATFIVEIIVPLLLSFSILVVFPRAVELKLTEYTNQQTGRHRSHANLTELVQEFRSRFGTNRTLFYAPNQPTSMKIMNTIDKILLGLNFTLNILAFDSVKSMDEELNKTFNAKGCEEFQPPIAAIVFRKLDKYPQNFSYVIRPMYFKTANTLYIHNEASSASFEAGTQQLLPSDYITSGFLYIQCLLNTAMLFDQLSSKVLGDTVKIARSDLDLNNFTTNNKLLPLVLPMPLPDQSLLDDPILTNAEMLYSVSCIVRFYAMLIFIKRILDEKSSKMTELLRLMSMKEKNYWIAKWIFYTAYFLFMNIAVTIMFSFSSKGRINLLLFFFYNMLYSMSSMFMASALTAFCSRPISGIGAYIALQVLNARPLWRYLGKPGLQDSNMFRVDIMLSETVHFLAALVLGPNYGAILFLYMLYEAGAYSHSATFVPRFNKYTSAWANLFTVPPEYTSLSLGVLLISIILSGSLWLVCLWYFRQLWPSDESCNKPFYFPLQPIIKKFGEKPTVEVIPNSSGVGQYFEEDPPNLELGLCINDVTKHFGQKVAVNNVTLRIYIGQITVLLGHNGAGKTTLIQMITGFIPPSKGQIYVNGSDIQESTATARRRVGYCPQHTILYNDLSVEEHLWFFGSLQGFSRSCISIEIDRVLHLLHLRDKRFTLARHLSGGMKKKLQMAIAILGSSNILIMDEPSSGLDIEARRMIWDILISLRKTYLIFLTTHHMEEADCLGDRIAIMHEGQLKSCGSPGFLKQAFSVGYNLTVLKAKQTTQIAEFLQDHINSVTVENETSNEIVFGIPPSEKKKLPSVLRELERNLEKLGGTSFGLNSISVDSVFLKATAAFDETKPLTGSELTHLYHGTHCPGLGRERFLALLQRRFYGWKRNLRVTLGFILMSLLTTLAAVMVLTYEIDTAPPLVEGWSKELDPRQLGYRVEHGFCTNSSEVDTFCAEYASTANSYGVGIDVTTKKPEEYSRELSLKNYERYVNETLIGGSLRNILSAYELFDPSYLNNSRLNNFADYEPPLSFFDNSLDETFPNLPVAYYNPKAFHSPAASLNVMYTKLLRELVPNGTIELGIHTFPHQREDIALNKLQGLVFNTYISVMILMLGFIFVVPYPSVYATKERVSKTKYLLEMAGVKFWSYWSSNFIFDLSTTLVIFIPFWIIVSLSPFLFGRDIFFTNLVLLAALFLAFLGFVLCSIVLTYICSMKFTEASTVYTFIAIPSFVATAVLNYVVLVFRMIPQTDDDGGYSWYQWLFLNMVNAFCYTCPFWLFGDVIVKLSRTTNSIYLCKKYSLDVLQEVCKQNVPSVRVCCPSRCGSECFNERYNPFTFDDSGVLVNLLLLFSMFICYALALWFIERRSKRYQTTTSDIPVDSNEDSDVRTERLRVSKIIEQTLTVNEAFLAHNLAKTFKKSLAVDHLSFNVSKKQCFGLLGFNGAGKTTTFKMIVGEILPSSGTSYVGSTSIENDLSGYVRQIGYCPQFDPSFHCLTGLEALQLFATVRGIPKHYIKNAIDQMVALVGLERHAHVIVDSYSGGNKRKLSLAIALIGTPSVILLDEPSAGVDPVSRRKLWSAIDVFRKTIDGSIIFSSHTMDECEALCDRLVIMKKGRLQCIGSPQYLKTKFSKGYTLCVKFTDVNVYAAFDRHLKDVFPSTVFKGMQQNAVTYHITDSQTSISYVLEKLEEFEAIFKLDDYVVSNTSLEDIFLSFNKN